MKMLKLHAGSGIILVLLTGLFYSTVLCTGCWSARNVGESETTSYQKWKNSGIVVSFDNRSTPQIMAEIANYYGMQVVYQKGFDTMTRVATGKAHFLKSNLLSMLFMLESDSVHFAVRKEIIYVKR